MQNILNYVKFRRDISFHKMPFNEADALAFMAIAYLDYAGLIDGCEDLVSVCNKYLTKKMSQDPHFTPSDKEQMLLLMAGSPRYKKVKIENFIHEISGVECRTTYAVTFYLSAFHSIVAFPGTDETLLSWKENFSLLYKIPSPGQLRCTEYLSDHLVKWYRKTMVLGHSKGGTLGAYAAMHVDEKKQKQISDIYLFDATGQACPFTDSPEFLRVADKFHTFVPVDCVIGKLFFADYPNRKVVNSPELMFGQHEVMNWSVEPSGFDYANETSAFSDRTAAIFNRIFENVPLEKREAVIEELFSVFFNNGITKIEEINHMNFMNSLKLIAKYPSMSPETKNLLKALLKEMKNG